MFILTFAVIGLFVFFYLSAMKYLIGIVLIGLLASCGQSQGKWVLSSQNNKIIKMNSETGRAYLFIYDEAGLPKWEIIE